MTLPKTLKIGTRKSALAVVQAELVATVIKNYFPDISVEILQVMSSGDKKRDMPETEVRDKKDWIRELEEAIVDGEIDIAIHSAKDVPIQIDERTTLSPVLEREVPFDCFVSREVLLGKEGVLFADIPPHAKLATSSLRRKLHVKALRPDIEVLPLRGNIHTRLEKLKSNEELAGIVIAAAGLLRLNLSRLAKNQFSLQEIVPAVNQGILCAQYAKDYKALAPIIDKLIYRSASISWKAERDIIAALGADCDSSIGVFCAVSLSNEVNIFVSIVSRHGDGVTLQKEVSSTLSELEYDVKKLADDLIKSGARDLL